MPDVRDPLSPNERVYTAAELQAMRAAGEVKTDLARIRAMSEADLERSIEADPDWRGIPADWHKGAKPVFPEPPAPYVPGGRYQQAVAAITAAAARFEAILRATLPTDRGGVFVDQARHGQRECEAALRDLTGETP